MGDDPDDEYCCGDDTGVVNDECAHGDDTGVGGGDEAGVDPGAFGDEDGLREEPTDEDNFCCTEVDSNVT